MFASLVEDGENHSLRVIRLALLDESAVLYLRSDFPVNRRRYKVLVFSEKRLARANYTRGVIYLRDISPRFTLRPR